MPVTRMNLFDPDGILADLTHQGLQIQELHHHIHEHLRRCAPLAWKQALLSCPPDSSNSQPGNSADQSRNYSCQAYHQIWQYLRLLGINTSIDPDSGFLLAAAKHVLCNADKQKILVSAASDFGLLAHLLWAGRLVGSSLEVSVLDRCQTALWANGWYAAQQNRSVELCKTDILASEAEPQNADTFDLIVAHNLLVFFPPQQRERVLTRWLSWLKPGGHLMTVVTLRPGSSVAVDQPQAMTEGQVARVRIMTADALSSHSIDLPDAVLVQAAERFARNARVYHLSSEVDFLRTLAEHGFQVRLAQCSGEANPIRDAPGQSRVRLRVLARKPA